MSSATTLSSVNVSGSTGQFTCNSTLLAVGMTVTLTGGKSTGSGSIFGYSSPTTYRISATNGSTTFTLTTLAGGTIFTQNGSADGTFTLNNFIGSGRSITSITRSYLGSSFTRIVMNQVGNNTSVAASNVSIVVTNSISTSYANAISTARNDFLVTNTDWNNAFAAVGDSLSLASFIVAGQTITGFTTSYATVSGVAYTRIVMSTNGNNVSSSGANQTVTICFLHQHRGMHPEQVWVLE
jgi:hypothetical protein